MKLGIELPEESAAVEGFVLWKTPKLEAALDLVRERQFLTGSKSYQDWLTSLGKQWDHVKEAKYDCPLSERLFEDRRQAAIARAVSVHPGSASEIPPSLRRFSKAAAADPSVSGFGTSDADDLVSFFRDPSRTEMSFGPELTSHERYLMHTFSELLGLEHESTGSASRRRLVVRKKTKPAEA